MGRPADNLGALVPSGGRVRLAVIDLDDKTSKVAAAIDREDIGGFAWVNDNRLVFSVRLPSMEMGRSSSLPTLAAKRWRRAWRP
jgi:hypothetical protein